jgi:hypothetical protein
LFFLQAPYNFLPARRFWHGRLFADVRRPKTFARLAGIGLSKLMLNIFSMLIFFTISTTTPLNEMPSFPVPHSTFIAGVLSGCSGGLLERTALHS